MDALRSSVGANLSSPVYVAIAVACFAVMLSGLAGRAWLWLEGSTRRMRLHDRDRYRSSMLADHRTPE